MSISQNYNSVWFCFFKSDEALFKRELNDLDISIREDPTALI